MTSARTMTDSTITTMGRVMARAPSPTSGCQKSGAPGGSNSSAAKTAVVTAQPPSSLRSVRSSSAQGKPRARAAGTSSRAVNTVTDPHRGDSGTHPEDQTDRQDPHLVQRRTEPPGGQPEDEHRGEQGREGVPPLAQVRAGDHLRVHRGRAAVVAL